MVTLRGTRAYPNHSRGVRDRPAGSDECREDLNLSGGASVGCLAPQVPFPHASRLVAASQSSRPSIGMS
jgi:hypothetical protein